MRKKGGVTIPTANLVLYQRFNNSVADETGNHTPISTGVFYANGLYSGSANESAVFSATKYLVAESRHK